MNLGELILELKPLLADASKNAARITKLLEQHQSLAEFEVARFYASRAFAPVILEQAASVDPRERTRAAEGSMMVLARADAAKLLRRLVKDPDAVVRSKARRAVKKFGLDDVALPDTRFKPGRSYGPPNPRVPGGWNPSGWSFGLYRRPTNKTKKVKELPTVSSTDQLASLLGLASPEDITPLLRAGEGTGSPYVAFEIPKNSGGTRKILAPRSTLKAVQRKILDAIVSKIPTHEACHGFTKKRSIVTNAKKHLGSKIVLRFDLLDFFPTIHYRRVLGMFRAYGYPLEVASALAGLTTHRSKLGERAIWPGALPQGAPTSPAIANVLCRRLDARMTALAKKVGARYTRYADDLTFSFERDPEIDLGRFMWWVDQICQSEGFVENPVKRRVYRKHTQQRVTGLVVNDKLTVPREARRRFRAMLHRCKKEGLAAMLKEQPKLRAELAGFAAFVKMVQPELGEKLTREIEALA